MGTRLIGTDREQQCAEFKGSMEIAGRSVRKEGASVGRYEYQPSEGAGGDTWRGIIVEKGRGGKSSYLTRPRPSSATSYERLVDLVATPSSAAALVYSAEGRTKGLTA